MGAKEFKVSFEGILFNKRRVRNEITWPGHKSRQNNGLIKLVRL